MTRIDAGLPRSIAHLLAYPVEGSFDLALHHVPPDVAALSESEARLARRNLFWSMWGWPTLPPHEDWVSRFAEGTQHFDYIVAYDPDSAAAFLRHTGSDRLHIVLGGYNPDDWTENQHYPPPNPRFIFGMNGRLTVRKGVYITYKAFLQLCEEHGDDFDAELVLRSTEPVFPPGFIPADDRVKVILARSLPPTLAVWYRQIDTLVCPSYSESKHLPPIEALTCGTPVILSDIPGHRGWALQSFATYVPTTQQEILPGFSGGVVSVEDLAAAMWTHYTQREKQRVKAQIGARTLPAMLSWDHSLERLGQAVGLPL